VSRSNSSRRVVKSEPWTGLYAPREQGRSAICDQKRGVRPCRCQGARRWV